MFKTEGRHSRIIVTGIFIVFSTFNTTGFRQEKVKGFIYILIWTSAGYEPFNFIDMGHESFRKCAYKNCYLTSNHKYFKNVLDYDVIMFNNINLEQGMDLPSKRSAKQKYCMYGLDTAVYHLIHEEFNGFFNITFTYKLSSNITIPYVVVKNLKDEVIGPQIEMHWMKLDEMNETSDYVKQKLQNKSIAAAWIVSHCDTPWRRMYAKDLQTELTRYGHSLDIFGLCGTRQCPKGGYGTCGNTPCPQYERMDECLAYIESDYYFYLSFENSFSVDYVTEKLLHALEHFAVPVVFGRANYSRFMPTGIYLDANVLKPDKMAEKMNKIINDPKTYYDFFKWHDHYSFHFSGEDRYNKEMCSLCAFLNNSVNKTSVYENITEWWNEGSPAWPPDTPVPPQPIPLPPQNTLEKLVTNLINFFDPSTD